MHMNLETLHLLSRQHPAWQLLRARNAPLVASFLYAVFVEPNVRTMPQSDLVEALEDRLYALRAADSQDRFRGLRCLEATRSRREAS